MKSKSQNDVLETKMIDKERKREEEKQKGRKLQQVKKIIDEKKKKQRAKYRMLGDKKCTKVTKENMKIQYKNKSS